MKPVKLFGEKILAFPHFKRVNRWLLILFSVLLPLIVVSTAYASFSWISVTGPAWGPNSTYRLTVHNARLTGTDKTLSMAYTVTISGESSYIPCLNCSRLTPITTTWWCDIPGPITSTAGATVNWVITSYNKVGCPANPSPSRGPNGSFSLSPTALGLTSFTSGSEKASILSNGSILLLAGVVALLLLVLVWRYRIRKRKPAIS